MRITYTRRSIHISISDYSCCCFQRFSSFGFSLQSSNHSTTYTPTTTIMYINLSIHHFSYLFIALVFFFLRVSQSISHHHHIPWMASTGERMLEFMRSWLYRHRNIYTFKSECLEYHTPYYHLIQEEVKKKRLWRKNKIWFIIISPRLIVY